MANRILRAPMRRASGNSNPQPNAGRRAVTPGRRVLRLNAVGFKPHPHPNVRGGADDEHDGKEYIQQYSFKVLADMSLKEAIGDDVLSETGWTQVNPRGRKLVGIVMDAIEQTWREYPGEFYRINRGTVWSAESITWDKASKTVEIVFVDPDKHGIVDGAHSLAKLVSDLIPQSYGAAEDSEDADEAEDEQNEDEDEGSGNDDEPTPDRYVSCEVWVGLTKEEVVRLTEGRNTSRTVPPFAISNLRGDFDDVKGALQKANPEFAKKVAFKPNEHLEPIGDDDETYKPLSALSILQLMMCMDVTNYSENDQPIEAYKNQGFIPRFWDKNNDRNRIAEYKKMLPILSDLLELYDTIREAIPEVYDTRTKYLSKIPRRWNKVLARKPKQRVETDKREPLYYLDPTGDRKTYRAPTALFYPIMCAFRACLRVNGKYEWFGGKKPTAWNKDDLREACLRLAVNIASLAKTKDSLHAVGRDEAVWAACYKELNTFLFEYGIKSRHV